MFHCMFSSSINIQHLPEYNDWVVIAQQEVDFDEDSISVDIPIGTY